MLQCTSETELFICDGQLLPASYSVISRLRESTKHLDFRANIRNIYYSTFVSIKKTSSVNVELKAYIYDRYNDIVDDTLYNFALYMQCVQTGIVKSFHASQNAFVAEKMFVRPGILNLSNVVFIRWYKTCT